MYVYGVIYTYTYRLYKGENKLFLAIMEFSTGVIFRDEAIYKITLLTIYQR